MRNINTGYLMNYNFLSPRPYCWTKDALLSGWEVDKSGGTWACHPTCRFPDGFAFHSDWFKLIDTSNVAAVTIQHKIARQTRVAVTLEYRFKMPKKMDGVAWQLRDLTRAGFSVVTADGSLCYERPLGKPVLLQPYEADRDYGVKVVANLTTKTADVYVDGALKAKAAPFCRPIASIDYVLVKTGDTAVGEMFLAPVNVYKGYAVNETFVTSGRGRIPRTGRLRQAAARRRSKRSNARRSRHLQFEALRRQPQGGRDAYVSVGKSFAPLGGKTVFQCRFLLPEKGTPFFASLYSREADGLVIATIKDDLCMEGHTVPLVQKYRSNLWYMLKVIADPVAKTADIFVNGKPAAEHVALNPQIQALIGSALRHNAVVSHGSTMFRSIRGKIIRPTMCHGRSPARPGRICSASRAVTSGERETPMPAGTTCIPAATSANRISAGMTKDIPRWPTGRSSGWSNTASPSSSTVGIARTTPSTIRSRTACSIRALSRAFSMPATAT